MRKTGSREPLESLEASVVSPCSIAVNTFSMRIGSRRNQRPLHQKIRSITTVSPTIDTIKIGHMIGPPLWNLSINQLLPSIPPLGVASGAGGGLSAAGLNAAVIAGAAAAGYLPFEPVRPDSSQPVRPDLSRLLHPAQRERLRPETFVAQREIAQAK